MTRRVLLTGGAGGIGSAIVRDLVAAGYHVHFLYNQSADKAEALRAELAREHPDLVSCFPCDLAAPEAVDALASQIEESSQPYYAFVHNAGTTADALGAMVKLDVARRLMQVNLWSFARLFKAVVRPMSRARQGRIVVVSSLAAHRGSRGNAVYAASKAALEAYCRCLVDEMASKGITVNSVAPGFIDTRMVDIHFLDSSKDALARRIPAGRYGDVSEVAQAVRFLLQPSSQYVNGATLVVDGGLSATVGLM
ncbi:MAG TPA: SDR family NAD(P)-dependent oxidoreductase [Kofleriaceae bacterium]|nr:SDR family NAD(P)-dependent oxidoreductase [Kofleriaceae bacterium]